MNADMPVQHVWPADEYYANSSGQRNAAFELLHHIQLKGNEQILDVGCGDGKITAKIAGLVSQGSVLGTDISPEMIMFAQQKFDRFPNLRFLIQDAQRLDYEEKFDVVFSSFALQWVPDQASFFKGAFKSLKPSGFLAVTVPLSISEPLEQAIGEITALPEWAPYFQGFDPGYKFNDKQVFAKLLEMTQFIPAQLEVVSQDEVFSSREALEKYVHPWFVYLESLPEELKRVFFKQIMDRYFELEPLVANGEAHLKFSRLDIVAIKKLTFSY